MARTRRSSRRLPGKRMRAKAIALVVSLIIGASGFLFLPGKVISVADGDTLTIMDSGGTVRKIRLYGIDCPETRQAGGRAAADFTHSLAFFSKVKVQQIDKDQYGRSVAVVALEDGRVLNEELLKNGHAWLYEAYCKTPRCLRWKVLEAQARTGKRGLWKDKKPVPPWKWRKSNPR